MRNAWEKDITSLSKISVTSNPNNQPVTIHGAAENLRCIGVGTDAAVFQSLSAPAYAYKLYAQDQQTKASIEAQVYKTLAPSPSFAKCFAATDEYLVLSYEAGITLYDCILQGIHIPRHVVDEVEQARAIIESKGLNPRDIHLKNILLQNGKVKILDVSEYAVPGNDFRWETLKKGYEQYYHLIDSVPVPQKLVTAIEKWYNEQGKKESYETLSKAFLKLFFHK